MISLILKSLGTQSQDKEGKISLEGHKMNEEQRPSLNWILIWLDLSPGVWLQFSFRFWYCIFQYKKGGGTHLHFAAHCTKSASTAVAKCFITAENKLNFEKWLKSCISLISSKVSTFKYKLLHELYLNAFSRNLRLFSSILAVPSSSLSFSLCGGQSKNRFFCSYLEN